MPVTLVPALLLAALLAVPCSSLCGADGPTESPQAKPVDFDRDVKPIFAKHCVSCHGPEKQKSGLRLDRKADALGRRHGLRSCPASRPTACSFNS